MQQGVERLLLASARADDRIDRVILDGLRVVSESADRFRDGDRIGGYTVERSLARGGLCSVYLARVESSASGRKVAIKMLQGGLDSDTVVWRARAEQRILATLDHPNIARLLDFGETSGGLPYSVMEYVEGVSILETCLVDRLPLGRRLELFSDVCGAVAHLHRDQIAHCDLKPGNVLVRTDGVVKLLDFGTAELLIWDGERYCTSGKDDPLRFFTPAYASPEQVRGDRTTLQTDVYSLGVMLYELLTDRRPYSLDSNMSFDEMARTICETEPERPSLAVGQLSRACRVERLSGQLDELTLGALQKTPACRPSAEELFTALRFF